MTNPAMAKFRVGSRVAWDDGDTNKGPNEFEQGTVTVVEEGSELIVAWDDGTEQRHPWSDIRTEDAYFGILLAAGEAALFPAYQHTLGASGE